MDRFGRSFRFCHPEFDKEAISDGMIAGVKMSGVGAKGVLNLESWASMVLVDLFWYDVELFFFIFTG